LQIKPIASNHLREGGFEPLTRESLMLQLITHLSKLTYSLFDDHFSREYIMAASLRMAQAIDKKCKEAYGNDDHLSLEQFINLQLSTSDKLFHLTEKAENKVVVCSNTCPFEKIINEVPNLCMVTSAIFGGIAALNFGFSKVSLRKQIVLGDSCCEVCIYVKNDEESAQEDGIVYTKESVNKVTEYTRVRFDTRQAVRAREKERERIGLELHDGPLQDLVDLHYRLETIKRLLELQKVSAYKEFVKLELALNRSMSNMRNLLVDMSPPILDDMGLMPAVKKLVRDFRRSTGVKAGITIKGAKRRLSAADEMLLYHIIREALVNVKKHAKASAVEVTLEYGLRNLMVTVRDNGAGFNSKAKSLLAASQRTLGILGMKERAKMLGGLAEIDSQPGKGTEVIVNIPIM
jgi:signal transduction histidine kinase